MALVTSRQLTDYYNKFSETDVTFTKEVVAALGLRTKQTFVRFLGYQVNCIIYSSSMVGAKIIANVGAELFAKLREANNLVSLRFCFDQSDKQDPMAFFVGARVTGFSPYSSDHPDLNFISLVFNQRPSDELIALLGSLIEANTNAQKRSEERIALTPDALRKLGFRSKEAALFIGSAPRKCILQDLSFSGAKVLTTGVAKFLVDQPAVIKLQLEDQDGPTALAGKIVRFEEIQDRKGIGSLAIKFDTRGVPMQYKLRLSEYFAALRKPKE